MAGRAKAEGTTKRARTPIQAEMDSCRAWPGSPLFYCLVNFAILVQYKFFKNHGSVRATRPLRGNSHAAGWPWNIHHYSL